jgi:UDP-N-acetylmuramate: L-alanyl-gamma-D-glutamyl-meso-diaminopimelate ligase
MTPSSPPELPPLASVRHVHLVAVAGTAMGTLACMLAARGVRVTGSDSGAYPPMSDQLREAGIAVKIGFAPENALAERPDLVVIGNAVRRENLEARAVVEAGLPYVSQADAVRAFFIDGKHSVVIAGTHGKTTTTSMVGWILTHAGLDPGMLVGGVTVNFGRSFRLGDGAHFVIEGDEYDTAYFDKTPKFLHYAPRSVLFTSCEFDHADIYRSFDEVKAAFRSLVERLPRDGRLLAASGHPGVASVVAHSAIPHQSYGTDERALWRASDARVDEGGTRFAFWKGPQRLGELWVCAFGRHNVENAAGAAAMCLELGVAWSAVAAALREYQGVRRRQEVRGEAGGVVVIDDFAHHPTAVRETIGAIRARYPEHALWAIFEPRSNTSRRRIFEAEFTEALAQADRVLMSEIHRADQIPEDERLRPAHMVESLRQRGIDASSHPSADGIMDAILAGRTGRDVALIMSNGDFGGIYERLLEKLRKTEEH